MKGERFKFYGLMAGISIFVRQFLLPSPFEQLPHPILAKSGEISIPIPPLMLNIIIEPVLHIFTFTVAGIYYSRGEFPAFGSLLYLIFYFIHVGLLALMAMTQFATWAIILILFLYISCHISLLLFINHKVAL